MYQLLSSDWNSDTVLFLGDQTNPLPLLMAFPGDGDARTGIWLGDRIEVRDDRPSENYKDVSKLYGALC